MIFIVEEVSFVLFPIIRAFFFVPIFWASCDIREPYLYFMEKVMVGVGKKIKKWFEDVTEVHGSMKK